MEGFRSRTAAAAHRRTGVEQPVEACESGRRDPQQPLAVRAVRVRRWIGRGLWLPGLALTSAVCWMVVVRSYAAVAQAPALSRALDSAVRPATAATATAAGSAVPAQRLTVRLEDSRVYVFVGKTGLGHDHGVEGRLRSGWLTPGASADAGELVFDMQSFDADTAAARRYVGLPGTTDASTRRQVNDNMRGPAILDVRRFPTATFRIRSARPVSSRGPGGRPLYQLDGSFTLHGITHPLQVMADVTEADGAWRVQGSFAIQQTAYGITPFRKALGAVGVTNQLKIHGDLRVLPETAG